MKYTITLLYQEDDATGYWGLIPEKAPQFNSFWSPEGIFHDVFEHYCEGLKYFSEPTVWGEACATGHAIAYHELGLDTFKFRKWRNSRDFKVDTIEYCKDMLVEDYNEYPTCRATCEIPYQKPVHSYTLESTISDYIYDLKYFMEKMKIKSEGKVWIPGIARAYRYGYRKARKIAQAKNAYEVLDSFLNQWNILCKLNPEYLDIENSKHGLHSIEFTVSVKNNELKVKQKLIEKYTFKKYNLNYLISE